MLAMLDGEIQRRIALSGDYPDKIVSPQCKGAMQ